MLYLLKQSAIVVFTTFWRITSIKLGFMSLECKTLFRISIICPIAFFLLSQTVVFQWLFIIDYQVNTVVR